MGTYDRQVATALRLLTKFGRSIEVVSMEASFDPEKPWRTDRSVEAVQTTVGVFDSYQVNLVDGTLIQAGDQRVLVPASGLTAAPDVTGEIRVDGARWKIVSVRPVSPNGQTIMYDVQVRSGVGSARQ